MGKCSVCKETVLSGFVVCGSCAKNALSGRFAPELAFYINELAKDLAQSMAYHTNTMNNHSVVQAYRDEFKWWLTEKAKTYFSRTVNT